MPQPAKPMGLDGRRRGKKSSLQDVLVLQWRVFEASKAKGVRPADLASLARAWDILEERKRILRGKPLPGSLRPKDRKPTKASTLLMPVDFGQDSPDGPDGQEGISLPDKTVTAG